METRIYTRDREYVTTVRSNCPEDTTDNAAYFAVRAVVTYYGADESYEAPSMYVEVDASTGVEVFEAFATVEECNRHGKHVYPVVMFAGLGGVDTLPVTV
jgi:hypothetical protein